MDGTTTGNEGNGDPTVEMPTPADIVPPDVARLVDEPVALAPPVAPPPAPPVEPPHAGAVIVEDHGTPWLWWIGVAVAVVGLGVMVYVIAKRRRGSDETHD